MLSKTFWPTELSHCLWTRACPSLRNAYWPSFKLIVHPSLHHLLD